MSSHGRTRREFLWLSPHTNETANYMGCKLNKYSQCHAYSGIALKVAIIIGVLLLFLVLQKQWTFLLIWRTF